MERFPPKLLERLEARRQQGMYRELKVISGLADFASNDYLGFARSNKLQPLIDELLAEYNFGTTGATGSRLLTGNHPLFTITEATIAALHKAEAALIFNSGFDANLGLLSCLPQRDDVVIYDEFIHASLRDGIRLSSAKSVKFRHNDLQDLAEKLNKLKSHTGERYIVTESVFSMDGDSPNLHEFVELAGKSSARLIVDEAHAIGFTKHGLIPEMDLELGVFARIITFGKAHGCHGAAVLGPEKLKEYLCNFARSLIFTTALSPHSVATIRAACQLIDSINGEEAIRTLKSNIDLFRTLAGEGGLQASIPDSRSPVQSFLIRENRACRTASENLATAGFDIRPILSPTVPKGSERLRISLHSFNSEDEIRSLIKNLATLKL